MQLEERLNQIQTPNEIIEFTPTIDSYLPGTTVLYSAPIKIYDLPNIGVSIHLHGTGDILYGGTVKEIGSDKIITRLNSYESAMADYYLGEGLSQGIGRLIEPNNR